MKIDEYEVDSKTKLDLLIVDDNPHDAEIIRENVQKAHLVNFHHRETLKDALDFVRAQEVDLILLDVNLPDTAKPLEGLSNLLEFSPQTPVVIVTGDRDSDLVNKALESGASDFLIKGKYRRQRLNSLIQALFQKVRHKKYVEKVEKYLDVAVQKIPAVIWSFSEVNRTHHIFGSFESVLDKNESSRKMNFHNFLKKIESKNARSLVSGVGKCQARGSWVRQLKINSNWYQVFLERVSSGEEIWYVGLMTDITDLKTSEIEARLQKQRAEKASQAKSDFLASVSHDLRTPLNGIIGSIQLMEKRNTLDKDLISVISNCSNTLLTLIDDVLDINSLTGVVAPGESSRVSLKSVIESCVDMIRHKAEEKGLTVNCIIGPEFDDLWVWIRERPLKKLFINLLSNAKKYTSSGQISIRAQLEPDSLDLLKTIRVEIEDSGEGIPSNQIEYIFEPYKRLNESDDDEGSKGFGLYICKKIIEGMGGNIKVKSKVGKGSTFTVTFNARVSRDKKQENVNVPARFPLLQNNSQVQILIVDDLRINRFILKGLVESLGYHVTTASSGAEALEIVEKHRCDFVLLDMRMPGMDGFETARELRARCYNTESKAPDVIAVSASTDKDYQKKCLESGCDEFLPKPVLINQLEEMLRKRIERRVS